MAVRKIGKRWFPVGKKGKTWKTGFATEAKAKAALTKANRYWGTKKTGKKKTAKKTTKKKTTKKKKSKKKKSGGGNTTNKNKMTPSNFAKMYAAGGVGIHYGIQVSQGADMIVAAKKTLTAYTGYDTINGKFDVGELAKGWGGIGNDIAWRKFCKAMGFQAYPTSKPKTLSSFLDYLTMYGVAMGKAYANKDNMREANRQVYLTLNGVDMEYNGFAAYQPMATIVESKIPYTIKKLLFKGAREMGYKI
ncbi:hypothetical protein KAR91_29750 [Candidatus Pacearchaeota archaeon]|nr:hypothetical protein [Candidatus Pacearchaeota archaeon]